MGCMQCCLLCGILVPFLLTGKGGWLSLSGKGKGTNRYYTVQCADQCSFICC